MSLTAADFPAEFKARMIEAYPIIAKLSREAAYHADGATRDRAFDNVLASVNIGPICLRWWQDHNPQRVGPEITHTVRDALTWNA